MLNVQRLVLHGDRLLHGDHVHADAAAAGRQQVGHARQRHIGHALKEGSQLRMLLQPGVVGDPAPLVVAGLLAAAALIDVQQLRGAGHEHGHKVPPLGLGRGTSVVVIVVAVVVFQQTQEAQPVQHLLKMLPALFRYAAQLPQLGNGVGLAQLHGQHDVAVLVAQQRLEAPVLRVPGSDLADLVGNHVGDHSADLDHLFPGDLVLLRRRMERPLLQFFIDHEILPF